MISVEQKQQADIVDIPITAYIVDDFCVSIPYSNNTTIENLLTKVITIINKKSYPRIYKICEIEQESFLSKQIFDDDTINWTDACSKSLMNYSKQDIISKGLKIEIKIQYFHKIKDKTITCEYMKNSRNKNAMHCPIYSSMKNNNNYTSQNLKHLLQFEHFANEYENKPICKHNEKCPSFIRMENNVNDANTLNDICHLRIYRHPPRNNRQIKLAENINKLIINTKEKENINVYEPTEKDDQKYKYNKKDGFINALIEEVINNGYKNDLCLSNQDLETNNYSLLKIVDEKFNHFRHKQIGQPLNRAHILALVLYTGCDCNYDLCKNQRNKNYIKWTWFDYCLYWAIRILSSKETGKYTLYSGLHNVHLDKNKILCGYFPTYISSTWNKNVSKRFMGNKGMIIEMDKEFRNNELIKCCDVSWISKFPDECEVLIARSNQYSLNIFNLTVLDKNNEIQIVSLKKNILQESVGNEMDNEQKQEYEFDDDDYDDENAWDDSVSNNGVKEKIQVPENISESQANKSYNAVSGASQTVVSNRYSPIKAVD